MISVSIVTVTRNDLAGLKATIDSVRRQSIQPLEQIVVDGASNDGTVEFLSGSTLPPFVAWTSRPDAGIYDAMNKGLARASGDFILMLNSGDRLANEGSLASAIGFLDFSRRRWGFGASNIEFDHGRVFMHRIGVPRRLRFFAGIQSIPHQATYIERALIAEIGPYRTDLGFFADQELLYRAWRTTPPLHIPATLAYCDGTGISSGQEPGAFVRQMAMIRETNNRPFGRSRLIDHVITEALRKVLAMRSKARGRAFAVSAGKREFEK